MTFLEKFKEEHPNAPLYEGCPDMCPYSLGYEKNINMDCADTSCLNCWEREIPKRKTMREVFFEAFPNAPRSNNENPLCCPHSCGLSYYEGCTDSGNCSACWSREVECLIDWSDV